MNVNRWDYDTYVRYLRQKSICEQREREDKYSTYDQCEPKPKRKRGLQFDQKTDD